MYIFPRQFKLHNVFTSHVDRTQTAQRFHDYTIREAEIAPHFGPESQRGHHPKVPKRLRGAAELLVQRLQVRHSRCSYSELLKHYCPSTIERGTQHLDAGTTRGPHCRDGDSCPASSLRTQPQRPSRPRTKDHKALHNLPLHTLSPFDAITDLANPKSHVSAFCQAALSKMIPNGFWGEGDTMRHNKRLVLRKVDHFIKLRRFETMSLHEIIQGLKVSLLPPLVEDHG